MNILFLSLLDFASIEERNIYTDLLREFESHGHRIYCISPVERRKKEETRLIKEDKGIILKLKIGNIQKVNFIEKGISTLLIEWQFIQGIKKYYQNIKFDLVLYATPPITFLKVVEYVKKRDGAISYLMLKDIFPQNAVDLGILSKTGIKGILYKYFRKREKTLYAVSDRIGCMSPANIDYIMRNNPEINYNKIALCPNSIEPMDSCMTLLDKIALRKKYSLPINKKILVYGGNLGKPQGVPFIIECLIACKRLADIYFVIIGSGTDKILLDSYVERFAPNNVKLLNLLPKDEYEALISCCDIGLIFLDYRFTVPNFPSRLLSYLQAKLPVLMAVDSSTDLPKIAEKYKFGLWCESRTGNGEEFADLVEYMCNNLELSKLGERGNQYLKSEYNVSNVYKKIMRELLDK